MISKFPFLTGKFEAKKILISGQRLTSFHSLQENLKPARSRMFLWISGCFHSLQENLELKIAQKRNAAIAGFHSLQENLKLLYCCCLPKRKICFHSLQENLKHEDRFMRVVQILMFPFLTGKFEALVAAASAGDKLMFPFLTGKFEAS